MPNTMEQRETTANQESITGSAVWGKNLVPLRKTLKKSQRILADALDSGDTEIAEKMLDFFHRITLLNGLLKVLLNNPEKRTMKEIGELLDRERKRGDKPISRNGAYYRFAAVGFKNVSSLMAAREQRGALLTDSFVFREFKKFVDEVADEQSPEQRLELARRELASFSSV